MAVFARRKSISSRFLKPPALRAVVTALAHGKRQGFLLLRLSSSEES